MAETQSFKSHTRWDPLFHFFILPVLLANVVISIVFYIHHRVEMPLGGIWLIVLSIALFMVAGKSRGYALKNQDRIIRLEEQVRLRRLMPDEPGVLAALSMSQLIGLRFASDAEVPALARRAVKENLDRKAIKAAIVEWRPDEDRV